MVGKRLVKLTNLMDWLNKILPDASVVRFELDAMGKVATVDVEGIGEFTRVKK